MIGKAKFPACPIPLSYLEYSELSRFIDESLNSRCHSDKKLIRGLRHGSNASTIKTYTITKVVFILSIMDEKFQPVSVKEEDNIQVTVAETREDIENDTGKDKEPLQSEFLEVRAAAEVGDDATMPCETFRAYTIAVVLTVLGATISNITQFREQPLAVEPIIIQLIALPIGRLWAKYMPQLTVPIGRWSFKLNPGTFTIKEHTLIVIMANVAVGYPPYALGLIVVQAQNYRTFFCDITDMRSTLRNVVQFPSVERN